MIWAMFLFNLVFLSFCIASSICTSGLCMESDQQLDMATAIARRLPEGMRLLIKAGTSINMPVRPGLTPLDAVLNLQQSDFQEDYPPVIKEMLSILILHGAHIDPKNQLHQRAYNYVTETPQRLLLAAVRAESMSHLYSALQKGARNQINALCYAAYRGKKEIAEALLSNKTLINQHNAKLRTPLYYAIIANHAPCVALLLRHGAHIALCDGANNRTAFEVALDSKSDDSFNELVDGISQILSSCDREKIYLFLVLYRLFTRDFVKLGALIARAGYYVTRDDIHAPIIQAFDAYNTRIKKLNSISLTNLFNYIKEATLGLATKTTAIHEWSRIGNKALAEIDSNQAALSVLKVTLGHVPVLLSSVLIGAVVHPIQKSPVYLLLREAPEESFSSVAVAKIPQHAAFDTHRWLLFHAYARTTSSFPEEYRNSYALLCAAVELDDIQRAEKLLANPKSFVDIDAYTEYLAHLLRRAVNEGSIETASMLIKYGASTRSNTDMPLTAMALMHEDYKLLELLLKNGATLPCSYKIYTQSSSQAQDLMAYEAQLRSLRPIEKRLYRLLTKYGGVLLKGEPVNNSVNAIILRVLFDNRFPRAVLSDNCLQWYSYCILHHILNAEHRQAIDLVSNVTSYLSITSYSNEDFHRYIIKALEDYLDTIRQEHPDFVYALANIFEFIKAKRMGLTLDIQQKQFAAQLKKATFLAKGLKIEHKEALLGCFLPSSTRNIAKMVKTAQKVTAILGSQELFSLIRLLVQSKYFYQES